MALQDLKRPWHSYVQQHMNEHMAEHSVGGKKYAFTWYDLELTYLLWHNAEDFRTICQNRIIKSMWECGETIERELWEVSWFSNRYDGVIIPWYDLCYQAQNLVYMYALWLVDILDKDLVDLTRDTTVRNIWRVWRKLDGDIPIFRSIIWMHEEISLDAVEDVRTEYIAKKPLAAEILRAWKEYGLKLNATVLQSELAVAS